MASRATMSKQAEIFFKVCHLGRWHREHKTWAGFIAAPHSVQLVAMVQSLRARTVPISGVFHHVYEDSASHGPSCKRTSNPSAWHTQALLRELGLDSVPVQCRGALLFSRAALVRQGKAAGSHPERSSVCHRVFFYIAGPVMTVVVKLSFAPRVPAQQERW
jgi:hypothetical protein